MLLADAAAGVELQSDAGGDRRRGGAPQERKAPQSSTSAFFAPPAPPVVALLGAATIGCALGFIVMPPGDDTGAFGEALLDKERLANGSLEAAAKEEGDFLCADGAVEAERRSKPEEVDLVEECLLEDGAAAAAVEATELPQSSKSSTTEEFAVVDEASSMLKSHVDKEPDDAVGGEDEAALPPARILDFCLLALLLDGVASFFVVFFVDSAASVTGVGASPSESSPSGSAPKSSRKSSLSKEDLRGAVAEEEA
jgi:hypothetical protein